MKIAILADIHGNLTALDAILHDIELRGGVDGFWILGDLCAIGIEPARVLERLSALPNATFVRGNVDRFVLTGERPDPTPAMVRGNPDLLEVYAEVAGSFAWTQGYLEAHGWLKWLEQIPLEQRITLPNGTQVLLVHAAPGSDDGEGLHPAQSDADILAALNGEKAALICVGHFHMTMDRSVNGTRIMNPGSVSNPFAPDLRAAYATLTADTKDYSLDFYRVDYDRQQVLEQIQRSSNPGSPYIARFLQGKVRAGWLNDWDGICYYPPLSGE
jgi:putative phosphoesterase